MELSLKIGRSYAAPMPAAAPPSKAPGFGETGRTGTRTYAGRLFEDYLTDLSGRRAVEKYDRMRRSDTQVTMGLRAIKLPVLQGKWRIQPSQHDPDKGDIAAILCDRMLFASGAGNSNTWRYTLRHGLLCLDYGFSLLEKVWEVRDRPEATKDLGLPAKVNWLVKLAPRLPITIDGWLGLDTEPYQLTSVRQRLLYGARNVIDIPVQKLAIFTNEMEGDNYEGRSILRSAVRDFDACDMLEKIDLIGLERSAIGISSITATDAFRPPDNMAELQDRYEQILENIQSQEQAWLFIPTPGLEFNTNTPTYSNRAIRDSIQAHKRAMSVNLLLQFMELGAQAASGSRAVATEQRGPFDLSVLAVADEVADGFNGVLEDIVRFNMGERPGYPTLTHTGVVDADMTALATIVKNLVDAGALVPDTDLEDWMRDSLKLPKAVRPEGEAPKQLPVPQRQVGAVPVAEPVPAPKAATRAYSEAGAYWRAPTQAERFTAFAQMRYDLDEAKQGFLRRVGEAAAEIASGLATDAAKLVATKDYERLLALKPAKVGKLQSRIKGELAPLVAYGRDTVRQEHARAVSGTLAGEIVTQRQDGVRGYAAGDSGSGFDPLSLEGIAAWQTAKAQRRSEAIAVALDAAVTDEGLLLIRAGADEETALAALTDAASKASDRAVVFAAGQLVAEAFGLGRGAETRQEVADGLITKGVYSALLDDHVCDACAALDGQEFAPEDPEFDQYSAGNPECYGGSACRCVVIYIYADEAPATVQDWQAGDNAEEVMPGWAPTLD